MKITEEQARIEKISEQSKIILKKKNKTQEIATIDKYLGIIRQKETSILVCGEFKRGKSSFINAFLEEHVCPVDVGITTSAVSLIKYGEKLRVIRQYGDLNNLKSEELSTYEEIEKYAKGSASEIDNTVLLIIETPSPKLKDGLVILDTPGVGGLDPRHAFLTTYFLPKADITVFVTDAGEPVTSAEITFFKKKILPYARQKVVLVNKADRLSSDQKVKDWIADVQKKLGDSENPVNVIPVSSSLKKDYLETQDKDSLEESNFLAVEKEINTQVETFKKKAMLELRDYLARTLENILTPIKMQIDQIKVPDPHLLDKIDKELQELREQKNRLSDPTSPYRMKIASIIKKARNRVDSSLSEESVLLSTTRLKELAASPRAKSDPNWLLGQLNDGISSISAELDLMIDDAEEKVIQTIGLKNMHASSKGFDYIIDTDLTPAEKSLGASACNMARHALPGMGIFALVGGLAATIFSGGTALPLVLGAASALGFVGKSVSDASKQANTAFLIEKLAPQISIAISHLRTYINDRFDEFNTHLIAGLQKGTQQLIYQMDSSLNDLNQLRQETAQQKQLKSQLLEQELKPVEQVLGVVKLFMTSPFTASGASEAKSDKKPTGSSDSSASKKAASQDDKTEYKSNDDKTTVG